MRGTESEQDTWSAERHGVADAHRRQRLLKAGIKIQAAEKVRQEAALDPAGRVQGWRKGCSGQIKEAVSAQIRGTVTGTGMEQGQQTQHKQGRCDADSTRMLLTLLAGQ